MKPFCRLILRSEALCRLVEAALDCAEIPHDVGDDPSGMEEVGILSLDALPSEEELSRFRGAVVILPFSFRASVRSEAEDRLRRVFGDAFLLLPRPFLVTDLIRGVCRFSDESGMRETFVPASPVSAPEPVRRMELSPEERTLTYGSQSIRFTPMEWTMFTALYEAEGEPVSREILRNRFRSKGGSNAVDVYIRYLRQKLEPLFGEGVLLSVRGEGYRLRLPGVA